jgi:membrane protease YdiL (CAAX protease family)
MTKPTHSLFSAERSPKTNALVRSIGFITVFIISLVIASMIVLMLPKTVPNLYYGIFGTGGAILTAALFVRLEKGTFASIGLKWDQRTLPRFIKGCAIGILLFSFVIGVVCLFGGAQIKPVHGINYKELLTGILPILPLALMEEIGFRSYPLVKLEKSYGIRATQFIIALAFALYHILNGWGIAISFMGPFIWAFVFGLAAIYSRGIALPTGIHFALNLAQNLTGLKNGKASFFTIDYQGSGNQYAGMAAHLLVLASACAATAWYVKRKKKFHPSA